MPSRNRSAKACDAASLSPKDTASDFSDIVHAPRHTITPALAKAKSLRAGGRAVQHPACKASDIVAGRPRWQTTEDERRSCAFVLLMFRWSRVISIPLQQVRVAV